MIDSYFSRIISTFCLAGATMLLQAQTDDINAIKNNPAYYSVLVVFPLNIISDDTAFKQ